MQQKHSTEQDGSWWQQLHGNLLYLYFRVSFISVMSPEKKMKIDHRFSFFIFLKKIKFDTDFLFYYFLCSEKNKNWTYIFIASCSENENWNWYPFFKVIRKRKTKYEVQNRFSKLGRKWKTKSKIQICFSMSCENEKWKWHLNSLFPCHRKTVGTKVHALIFISYF